MTPMESPSVSLVFLWLCVILSSGQMYEDYDVQRVTLSAEEKLALPVAKQDGGIKKDDFAELIKLTNKIHAKPREKAPAAKIVGHTKTRITPKEPRIEGVISKGKVTFKPVPKKVRIVSTHNPPAYIRPTPREPSTQKLLPVHEWKPWEGPPLVRPKPAKSGTSKPPTTASTAAKAKEQEMPSTEEAPKLIYNTEQVTYSEHPIRSATLPPIVQILNRKEIVSVETQSPWTVLRQADEPATAESGGGEGEVAEGEGGEGEPTTVSDPETTAAAAAGDATTTAKPQEASGDWMYTLIAILAGVMLVMLGGLLGLMASVYGSRKKCVRVCEPEPEPKASRCDCATETRRRGGDACAPCCEPCHPPPPVRSVKSGRRSDCCVRCDLRS